MARLKSRDKFPPGGFRFHHPETNWSAPTMVSFDATVQAVINHRNGNPGLAKMYGWPTDYDTVANQVDEYTASICVRNGWHAFVQGGAGATAAPFPVQTIRQSARHVVVGANSILEMFGGDPVPQEVANARGEVCLKCPLNGKGDLMSYFTVPAANAIRGMLGFVKNLKLSTPRDAELKVCQACYCPIPLKLWAQVDHIKKHMPQEDFNALDPGCWIKNEPA